MAEMVLTQNFKTFVNTMILGTTNISNGSSSGNDGNRYEAFTSTNNPKFCSSFKDTNGAETSLAGLYSSPNFTNIKQNYGSINRFASNNNKNTNQLYVAIGSGTTPATEADYNLKTIHNSGDYSIGNTASYLQIRNGKTVLPLIITVTSKALLSINEIGMFLHYCSNAAGQSSLVVFNDVLFGRCVLDEPVTLAAGESKTFELVVSLF